MRTISFAVLSGAVLASSDAFAAGETRAQAGKIVGVCLYSSSAN